MYRAICVPFLLLAMTMPCWAQDKAKPNTLTPKEIADGWILLFDGDTTFGWGVAAQDKSLQIIDGTMLPTLGTRARTTAKFSDFELRFEYMLENGKADVALSFGFGPSPKFGGKLIEESAESFTLPPTRKWTALTMRSTDKTIHFGDKESIKLPEPIPAGSICFSQKEGNNFKVRSVKLRPLNTKPLFNGKDFTGWKVFPGDKYKSKFTVSDKGELNVKDGPGDLQTTGKYGNFILQLECISNGKHLNGGIFFRCRDGEYQNGYEAQIHNKFTAEPMKDYTIEEYDPKTNKLRDKKKIKATAVDYGTGAIYRRQPARKEMAKDGDWFGMTIIAHGNHLATWVNGVQVTDWLDHRPPSDNPRTGCRLAAGHISIQGHDPTTNLSFRNLRIAELPADK